ncbi:MAG: OmpA family protein [Bacteroidota bacterium]|nr:OmpA family protein [Bacteroidota bacterium]
MKTIKHFIVIAAVAGVVASGCSTATKSQKGAVIGGGGGAVIGAVIGNATGNTARGAIIGAVLGGVGGAVIGHKMDKQAEEMKKVLGDAEVRREGEGIIINFKEKVLFGYDKSELGTSATTNLSKLVEILNRYPDTNIEIIGHTDNKGSNEYNQGLSERRANAVVNYLNSNGINNSRLTAIGKGETDPIVSNDTEDGRAQNRRVEFVITANEKMKAEAKTEAGQ